MSSLTHEHEAERLQALRRYAILDTGPEEAYDDLTRLAALLCHTPIALVALADGERLWFKSRVGPAGTEISPGSMPGASCATGAENPADEDLVVIEDLGERAERADGGGRSDGGAGPDWVREVRFYAGAPLLSPDGFRLGTLCVMDNRPRTLSSEQRETLRILARQVMTHLELRRNTRDLADTVAELRDAERTIRYMAYHDALTGLPGRLLFQDRLTHALIRAQRFDEVVAVMFLDLDGFKTVNDTWGHATGDRLLESVAARLTAALRKSDTVARIGGDEFALICPAIHGPDDAAIIASKLLAALKTPLLVDGLELSITASIGIALYPTDSATPESLVVEADTAMYRAKRHGKNTFAFCAVANCKSCELQG